MKKYFIPLLLVLAFACQSNYHKNFDSYEDEWAKVYRLKKEGRIAKARGFV